MQPVLSQSGPLAGSPEYADHPGQQVDQHAHQPAHKLDVVDSPTQHLVSEEPKHEVYTLFQDLVVMQARTVLVNYVNDRLRDKPLVTIKLCYEIVYLLFIEPTCDFPVTKRSPLILFSVLVSVEACFFGQLSTDFLHSAKY